MSKHLSSSSEEQIITSHEKSMEHSSTQLTGIWLWIGRGVWLFAVLLVCVSWL